jgi:F plasmid transfer operon protein TraF
MTTKRLPDVCWLALALVFLSLPATAQSLDELGNRATAMSAFVAVADDASAVAWNPAGLVNGPIFNILLDFGRSPTPKNPAAPADDEFSNHTLLAAGVPPFGLFYARGHYPAVEPADGRKEAQVAVRAMVTSSLGFTVLQSLADGLTVGATVKLVHGSLNDEGETTGDIDAGALFSRGRMRAGLVARNLTSPTFESSAGAITIERQVRAGVAWGNKWPGTADTIVSFDADLTRVPHVSGERRDLAAGAEKWFRHQTLAVRGGVRASTVDGARPVASAGGSIAVRSGFYVDVAAAGGRADDARWSVAARLMY